MKKKKGRELIRQIIRTNKHKNGKAIDLTREKLGKKGIIQNIGVQEYLNIIGVIVVVINKDRKVELINKKGLEVLGYKKDEIIGKDWFENFLPKNVKKEVTKIFKLLISGNPKTAEYVENTILTKNGEERVINWHNTLLKNANGKIIGTLSSGKDITERKKAEEKIKEKEKLYRSIVESTSAIAWELDLKTQKFTYVSPKAEEILGYHPNMWTDIEFWAKNIHEEDRKKAVNYCITQTLKGKYHEFEYRFKTKKGKYLWLKDKVTVIKKDGKPVSLQGYLFDITDQKIAEHILLENEERFNNLLINTEGIIFMIDKKGFFTLSEGKGLKVLGFKSGQLVGMSALDLYKDYPAIIKGIKEALNGRIYKDIVEVQGIKQKEFFDIFYSPTKDMKGKVTGLIGMAIDVTKRKKAIDLLKQQKEFSENILNTLGDGVDIVDENLNITFMNKMFIDTFGKEAIGKKCYMIYKINRKQCEECPLKKEIEVGKTRSIEVPGIIGGKTFFITHTGFVDADGTKKILEIFRDITKQKKAEEELKRKVEELEKFQHIIVGREMRMVELKKKLEEKKEGEN